MKKKGLVLVLVFLCLASLVAAMAYTSADVKAGYTIKVADSSAALLALSFNSNVAAGDCTGVQDSQDGSLKITFGNDTNGLQSGGTYVWQGLVTLKNNTTKNIKVTVTDSDSNPRLAITYNNASVQNIAINANETLSLDVAVKVPAGAATGANNDLTGNIVVSAVATN